MLGGRWRSARARQLQFRRSILEKRLPHRRMCTIGWGRSAHIPLEFCTRRSAMRSYPSFRSRWWYSRSAGCSSHAYTLPVKALRACSDFSLGDWPARPGSASGSDGQERRCVLLGWSTGTSSSRSDLWSRALPEYHRNRSRSGNCHVDRSPERQPASRLWHCWSTLTAGEEGRAAHR
jgi:hypothetical protein